MDFEEKFGEQITEKQAIEIHDSEIWKDWDDEQVVRFQLFQQRLAIPFSRFHEAVESVLGRPVFTHEFGMNYKSIVKEYLGTEKPPTLDDVINMIPEEKRIIVGL